MSPVLLVNAGRVVDVVLKKGLDLRGSFLRDRVSKKAALARKQQTFNIEKGEELWSPQKIFCLSFVGLLSACSSYQADFDCDIPRGVPCTSLSKISEMADKGFFEVETSSSDVKNCVSCKPKEPFREFVFIHDDGKVTRHEI